MAELGFILSRTEEAHLLQHVFEGGASLIPDVNYTSREIVYINTMSHYLGFRSKTRGFFIAHPSFVVVPLEVRGLVKDGREIFFIMQKNGGPVIDFFSSLEIQENNVPKIVPGFIAHYKTFWNTSSERNEAVPSALLDTYKDLSKCIKGIATRQKIGVRSYWLGKEVQQKIEAGQLQLGIKVH